jgi:phage terminase large subunit-like protein
MCRAFARQLDGKEKYISLRLNELRFNVTESKLKAVHSDSRRLDGMNVSFGVCDELHAFTDSSIFDVLQSSQVNRKNRHLCCITTAGFDESGFCYNYRQHNIENLADRKDDTLFTMIFTQDGKDEWKNMDTWVKSNPNLNVSVNADFLKSMRERAVNNPSETVPIKTKNFNIWCQTANVWINSEDVAAVMKKIDWDKLNQCRAFCGVDLASTSDLTALAWIVFDEREKPHAGIKYYLPSDRMERSVLASRYRTWIQHGFLTVTGGNVTDYDRVIEDIQILYKKYAVEKIGYDRYSAADRAIRCTEIGLPVEPCSQTLGNFNMPAKELERRIPGKKTVIERNPVTKFCFKNVNLKTDYSFNVKPVKSD